MQIGLISKKDNNSILTVNKLIELLRGHTIYFDEELASLLNKKEIIDYANHLDLIIWVGGDGTLLKYVNKIKKFGASLLGIKTGGVGFLCEISPEEIDQSFKLLFEGKYYLENRKLLEISHDKEVYFALNEVFVSNSEIGKTSKFLVLKDSVEIFKGKCDGIIVATSLGSTAYIASRGGPIVDPSLDVLILDPVNPLKWGSRFMILPFDSSLEIISEKDYNLIIDGNIIKASKKHESVKVKGSNEHFKFVRFRKSFYEKVRKRVILDV
ncbi:MAG: NAD(+)/NADH kinase [Thermoproteota archaeon]|jgi:NAD+ kinase|nr:NAD(+)/NADH kinase [Thermoproteota archaeon]